VVISVCLGVELCHKKVQKTQRRKNEGAYGDSDHPAANGL
jgi:hypothetical protein